jgi:hypothetical protein
MTGDRCLSDWIKWNCAEREIALHGPNGPMIERLLFILKLEPTNASVLLAYACAIDWPSIDHQTRLVTLHEIDTHATRLRERLGLAPFDDGTGLDERRQTVLVICRDILFPRNATLSVAAPPTGAKPGLIETSKHHHKETSP